MFNVQSEVCATSATAQLRSGRVWHNHAILAKAEPTSMSVADGGRNRIRSTCLCCWSITVFGVLVNSTPENFELALVRGACGKALASFLIELLEFSRAR